MPGDKACGGKSITPWSGRTQRQQLWADLVINPSHREHYLSARATISRAKERIPDFPRLDAASGGAIYFDREEVLGGVYDRSMFFVVPAFKLDSLNNADPASINFEGTFVSSGMFPAFKEKLHTQPDKSLGFEHKIPKYRLSAL